MSVRKPAKNLKSMRAFHALFHAVLLISLSVLFVKKTLAQTPAQIAAALATTDATALVDSLILSPIQRKNLEFVRLAGGKDGAQHSAEDQLLDGGVVVSDNLTVSGLVIRSGNRSTVWVNNQPLYGQGGESALRTLAGRAGVLKPVLQNTLPKTQPGQTIDIKTQQTTDLLPPGSIRIIPPKVNSRASGKQEQR